MLGSDPITAVRGSKSESRIVQEFAKNFYFAVSNKKMEYSPLSPCPFVPWRRGPCPLHRPSKEVYSLAQEAPSRERRPSGGALTTTNYSHAHANHLSLPAFPASFAVDIPRWSSPAKSPFSRSSSRHFSRFSSESGGLFFVDRFWREKIEKIDRSKSEMVELVFPLPKN